MHVNEFQIGRTEIRRGAKNHCDGPHNSRNARILTGLKLETYLTIYYNLIMLWDLKVPKVVRPEMDHRVQIPAVQCISTLLIVLNNFIVARNEF